MSILRQIIEWFSQNEAALSGIAALIVITGVVLAPLSPWRRRRRREAASGAEAPEPIASDRPSIAVLPFASPDDSRESESLADGLTEDIISELSRVRAFFVIARNSCFTYKGRAVDVREVSRELGVRYVLEGSVRRVGPRVRIGCQLIDATTGQHAWAERYDRPLDEIFELLDDVTARIVSSIAPAVSRAEAERVKRSAVENLDAWALVNRARVTVQRDIGDPDGIAQAMAECRRAIALDPDYAIAHAVLGHALSLQIQLGAGDRRALTDEATACLRRALALDANDSAVHHCYAAAMGNLGRTEDGVRAYERSLALNPNNASSLIGLGSALIFQRRPEDALAMLDRAIRLSPRDPLLYNALAYRAMARGILRDWEGSAGDAAQSVALTPTRTGLASLAIALAELGQSPEAQSAYDRLMALEPGFTLDTFEIYCRSFARSEEEGNVLSQALRRAAGEPPGESPPSHSSR